MVSDRTPTERASDLRRFLFRCLGDLDRFHIQQAESSGPPTMHMVRCAGTCGSCHGVACKPPFPAEVDLSVRGLCSNADVLCLGYTQSTAFNHVGIRMTQRRSAGRSKATFIETMCFNPFYSSGNPRGCPVVSCSSNR